MSFDTPAPGAASPDGRGHPAYQDPLDVAALAGDREAIAHAYVLALDRVLSRAQEGSYEAALRRLENVSQPPGVDIAHLLERKRRELRERFELARYQSLYLPGVSLDQWLAFFFAGAEMAGCTGVSLTWHEEDRDVDEHRVVAPEEGRAYRRSVEGRLLSDLHELGYASPCGHQHAALDVPGRWLTMGGDPWLFGQTLRVLDEVTGETPLDVALSYDAGREVQEGSFLSVRLVLRNRSNDVLVLEDLGTDHDYDPRETFATASLGRLAYDAERDCYEYDAVGEGATAAAFRTAVLQPGQERVVIATLGLLEGGECWRAFSLRYRRMPMATFREHAYVPVPGPSPSFPPRVTYAPLATLADARQVDLTTVLLAEHDAPLHTMTWAYPFHVGRRAFSLAQARGRLPEGAVPVHYSRWQQAWVLRLAEGCALVSPSRVTLYPRVDPRAFILIDESEQRVPVRFSDSLLPVFRSLPLGVTDWESHALGLSVSLPKLKLTSFFQEVERLGVALDLSENLLGRRTLWVHP